MPQHTHTDQEQADCIFCKIVAGNIPAVKFYEDDEILGFMDIYPNTRGHALIIPKDHIENIYGIPAEIAARLMIAIQKISVALKNAADADGINIVMNNESAAGQMIWHAHVHIIPRYNEDSGYIGQKHTYIVGEMEKIAKKIQGGL
jgi:histidine triad (HIT) family protein